MQTQSIYTRYRGTSSVSNKILRLSALLLIFALSSTAFGQAVQSNPPELKGVEVEEHLGGYIPLYLEFTNSDSQLVTLNSYFHKDRPVIIVLAYYTCPMLCTMVLNGLGDGVRDLNLIPGKDYEILTISIDPRETPLLAAAKKTNYVNYVGRSDIADGWTFFVGKQNAIDSLAKALGFHYYYDEEQKQFAHPAVVFVLSPNGEITRYLYGLEFKPKDIRFALLEAAQGKIGSTVEKIILYCYHYDPNAKGYVLFAAKLMRIGGVATVAILLIFLGIFWLRELRKPKS
jgi:protein SCO1